MRMPELKALSRESGLRCYSKLRKAELVAFLKNNDNRVRQRQQPTMDENPDTTLTKRQHKCRHAKDRKLAKRFINISSEINELRKCIDELKNKVSQASQRSARSRTRRKKIRSMKGDVDKISAQLADSEARLELLRVPTNPVTGAPIS